VLEQPTELSILVDRVKAALGLPSVRVAAPLGWRDACAIHRVAVCPGAGGNLLTPLRGADLYLTGEMRHHDVLAKVSGGSAVILTDHSNSERGYLPTLAARITAAMHDVSIVISAVNADPLTVV